jgi:hypothetical protein
MKIWKSSADDLSNQILIANPNLTQGITIESNFPITMVECPLSEFYQRPSEVKRTLPNPRVIIFIICNSSFYYFHISNK